jgi:mannose-6-phosphate isomerase-like protein (cupin superfamily)
VEEMAQIVLEPGERFEHTHATDSISVLESGTVDIIMNGVSERLTKAGLTTPGGVHHELVNTGTTQAVISCHNH